MEADPISLFRISFSSLEDHLRREPVQKQAVSKQAPITIHKNDRKHFIEWLEDESKVMVVTYYLKCWNATQDFIQGSGS